MLSAVDTRTDAEVVAQILGLVGSLDIDAARKLLDEDLLLELPFRGDGGPRVMRGKDALRFVGAMPALFSQLPFHDVVVHGALPSGAVVAEYKSDGITHGGRPYRNAYVALFRVTDGKIAEWREYFDPNVVSAAFRQT
jgi:ketosteroid isomerase-like protein